MPIKDLAAKERYPQIMEAATDLVKTTRHSPFSEAKLKEAEQQRQKYGARNEGTFLHKFYGVFREVKSRRISNEGLKIPEKYETREWEEDGLDENDHQPFRQGSIPKLQTHSVEQKKALGMLPRVSNPVPDIAYGS